MTQQEKLTLLSKAYTTKKVDDNREEITIINDELPREFYDALWSIQGKIIEEVGFEMSYDIMSDACGCVSDVPLEELADTDFIETETASVYTGKRLSYLTIINQEDITDIIKEIDVDIATACAIWYDRQVVGVCDILRNFILEK